MEHYVNIVNDIYSLAVLHKAVGVQFLRLSTMNGETQTDTLQRKAYRKVNEITHWHKRQTLSLTEVFVFPYDYVMIIKHTLI